MSLNAVGAPAFPERAFVLGRNMRTVKRLDDLTATLSETTLTLHRGKTQLWTRPVSSGVWNSQLRMTTDRIICLLRDKFEIFDVQGNTIAQVITHSDSMITQDTIFGRLREDGYWAPLTGWNFNGEKTFSLRDIIQPVAANEHWLIRPFNDSLYINSRLDGHKMHKIRIGFTRLSFCHFSLDEHLLVGWESGSDYFIFNIQRDTQLQWHEGHTTAALAYQGAVYIGDTQSKVYKDGTELCYGAMEGHIRKLQMAGEFLGILGERTLILFDFRTETSRQYTLPECIRWPTRIGRVDTEGVLTLVPSYVYEGKYGNKDLTEVVGTKTHVNM